jgi:transposase
MLDCSVTEAAAIGAAFEEDLVGGVPKPRILWCWFHLFKAVRAKATKCVSTSNLSLLS